MGTIVFAFLEENVRLGGILGQLWLRVGGVQVERQVLSQDGICSLVCGVEKRRFLLLVRLISDF